MSPRLYDYWLCGGAIVTPWYIVTSAACVEDVEYMYAIAGYLKYVPTNLIDSDSCTKAVKKKIVYTCVPRLYELDYAKIEKWSFIDIAVVKVESAYNFDDDIYTSACSYQPRAININYDPLYQQPNTDAMVFGWGHLDVWRNPDDKQDYNQEYMRYAGTRLTDKNECKQYFTNISTLMENVIDKYMLCSIEAGNINEYGEQIIKLRPNADGCSPIMRLLRQGEIENDHGGPLVTWIGSHEVLIGVASVFRVTQDSKCAGPFLYTSTQCNGIFLDCIINGENNEARRALCNKPPKELGFYKVKKYISWKEHPAGLADNEKFLIRPTKPFQYKR
ncbi:hypothetical protein ACJJTC_014134 [Scirpophaga incertulas]